VFGDKGLELGKVLTVAQAGERHAEHLHTAAVEAVEVVVEPVYVGSYSSPVVIE
jgi:hypothetical protein